MEVKESAFDPGWCRKLLLWHKNSVSLHRGLTWVISEKMWHVPYLHQYVIVKKLIDGIPINVWSPVSVLYGDSCFTQTLQCYQRELEILNNFFSLKFSQMKWIFFIIEYRSNQALLFSALLTTCDALRDKTRYIKVGNTFG